MASRDERLQGLEARQRELEQEVAHFKQGQSNLVRLAGDLDAVSREIKKAILEMENAYEMLEKQNQLMKVELLALRREKDEEGMDFSNMQ